MEINFWHVLIAFFICVTITSVSWHIFDSEESEIGEAIEKCDWGCKGSYIQANECFLKCVELLDLNALEYGAVV